MSYDPLFWINQDNYRTYNIQVAKKLRDVDAAIILSELVSKYNFHKNELINDPKHGNGWFFFTQESCEDRTALSRKKQDHALAILENCGLIEKRVFGLPARRYFRIKTEEILRYFGFSNSNSSLSQTDKLDCPKGANHVVPNGQTAHYIEEPKEEPDIQKASPVSPSSSLSPKEKKQAFKDNVFLTQKQHDDLVVNHNLIFIEKCYETLSLYKHSKGIEYKSDYHTILKWVIDAVKNDSKPSKSIKIEKSNQDTPEQRKAQGGVRINSKMWAHYAKKGHNMEGYILDENA